MIPAVRTWPPLLRCDSLLAPQSCHIPSHVRFHARLAPFGLHTESRPRAPNRNHISEIPHASSDGRLSALIAFAALALTFEAALPSAPLGVLRDGVDVRAVGDAGAIARSFDGSSLTSQTLGSGTLRDVAAIDLLVVVVSENGTISAAWTAAAPGGSSTLPGTPALHAVVATRSPEW